MSIPEIELRSPDEISRFQLEKVKESLRYLSLRSPFYKRLFATHKIEVSGITSWQDFAKLPFTTKDDLQQHNFDFLCVDKSKVVEYTSTSGTMGKAVTVALTEKDLQRLAYNESISFSCADGSSDDLYQLMLTLDRQFMAGIAYYEGIRRLGAGLIRVGPGLPALQWETIERLQPTALVAVPSFIVKLIEYAQAKGIDLNTSSVRKAICIGESLRTDSLELNTIGEKIKQAWNIGLYSTYASTEMQTAFTECGAGRGGHVHPELIHVELLDDAGNPVKDGEAGEVTITTLGIEGMPLLRYRTGDICRLYTEACSCGRNTPRLGPVIGRKQQMIKLKGTTLYPPAIFDIVQQVDHIHDYVVEAFTGKLGTDEVKLYISVIDGQQQNVERSLLSAFQSRLRVVPEIAFTSQKDIEALQQTGGRKLKKFVDRR
ncbi:AMP-binding protein [Fulvivirgaceae bacterium PWU4]|uniref:AMP-binding protein n=1 Tax=Chryseosolibacter histidini TaxID=2782349 RepID=A0AAP2DNN0_9BACT|nr:AMP-binding protein [Chryseosolibacter histidini]MBT1699706.1 AMP-binding protein [Chryseosolibacter histidini]